MTPEAIWANLQDLERIQRLANQGHFACWFPAYARHHALMYVLRILRLKLQYAVEPYPGPTVTEL